MIKRLEKRGSHVEMIISFIIFVVFVIFLIAMITPAITTQREKENIFDSTEMSIMSRIYSNLTLASVELGDEDENCINIDGIIDDLGIGENIVVKDSSGNIVDSDINGNSLRINRVNPEDKFFKIYYSPEFEELTTASGCTVVSHEVGLTKTRRYAFESKFIALMNEDYETLRGEFKTAQGIQFGYGLILSNGTTFETKNDEEVSTNVYIRETPIEYVDLNGNIVEGYLKTKIW